jgi:uncharacterized protein YcbX
MARVVEMYRYPVKGLSAERLQSTVLSPGEVIPFDRAYAIENGPSAFDPQAPKWISKIVFLMLMRQENLAELQTQFDEATRTLTIRRDGKVLAEGRLDREDGRRTIEAFFDEFSAKDLKGPAKVLSAPGHSFQDTSTGKVVSLINLESVRDLGRKMKADVHPLRFRANLYVEGLPAWEEFSWIGKPVVAGGAALTATKRIDRCAAVNVDPFTGTRDMNIPVSLRESYDNIDCGIYLKVVEGGELRVGDTIAAADD